MVIKNQLENDRPLDFVVPFKANTPSKQYTKNELKEQADVYKKCELPYFFYSLYVIWPTTWPTVQNTPWFKLPWVAILPQTGH